MRGPFEQRRRRPCLDEAAVEHHRDVVAQMADDGEIVADEKKVTPASRCRSLIRLSTCAWIETSSADTGSSATTSFGRVTSARAMAMRWRWPPENSCGYLSASVATRPTARSASSDARGALHAA